MRRPYIFCRGPWLIFLLGIEINLVYSEVINYEDSDANLENGYGDIWRTYGGYPSEIRSNTAHCPLAVPCNLMAGTIRALRSLLTELETSSNSYCKTAPNVMRYGPPPAFPSFPPFPAADSMQMQQMQMPEFPEFPQFPQFPPFPQFPQFPQPPVANTDPLYEQPYIPPSGFSPEYEVVNQPNQSPVVNVVQPETPQPLANVNQWGSGATGPTKIKVHKKVKIKTCTPRRSATGRKRYNAAAMQTPLQKNPEDEKNKVTVEVNVGTGAEDEKRKKLLQGTSITDDNADAGEEFQIAND